MFLILTGLILTFFISLFIITSIIHKKQFAYNTHQDYNYPSLPSTAHATLKGGSLTLPATVSGRDTIIAKIRIKSNWMGLLFLPFIETISSKGMEAIFRIRRKRRALYQSERHLLRQRQNRPFRRQIPDFGRSRNRTLRLSA